MKMTKNKYSKRERTGIDIAFEEQYTKFLSEIPFDNDRRKFSGIYKIVNSINGKLYVGSSKHIRSRWKAHEVKLTGKVHHSVHLQNAWNIYGIEAFKFEILEYVEPIKGLLKEREQYWIDFYNSANGEFGYNIRKKADSTRGSGKDQPVWNKGKKLVDPVYRNCQLCSKKFELKYSTDPAVFCGYKCLGKSRRKLIDLVCLVCKGHFQRRPSEIDEYCSRDCYYKTLVGNKRWIRKSKKS